MMRMWWLVCVVVAPVALMGGISSAYGADIPAKVLARCAALEGELQRLVCYDGLAKKNGWASGRRVDPSGTSAGKWVVSREVNPVNDSDIVSLVLQADSGQGKFGKRVILVVRCKDNTTEMYIRWHDYLGSSAKVVSRIGGNPARTDRWSLSTDHQATFFPRSPISTLLEMMKHDRYLAQVTPYNENPVTAIFDTAGLNEAIQPLRELCEWTDQRMKARTVERERARAKAEKEQALKETERKREEQARIREAAQSLGVHEAYIGFIEAHRGSGRVRVRVREWWALDERTRQVLDDYLEVVIAANDDERAVGLPSVGGGQ